jgi:selenide,water dikinase
MSIKLTQFSHGGGCGCKIAPKPLSRILEKCTPGIVPPDLLVGMETADDAAVYRLNDSQAIVATTDFFMPIVDDPHDFGRIAATNALSDVYAMGASPVLALAVVGMPIARLPEEIIATVLEGGAAVCREAGIPLAGGHSIDSVEPIYGLVALGVVHPERVKTNAGAQPGDALVLGKPLGVGILSAALKKDKLSPDGYAEMLRWTTLLNRAGTELGALAGVHAMTDVTGFGIAGHLLEMLSASKLGARLRFDDLPVIGEALRHVQDGIATGASQRNWDSYGDRVRLPTDFPEWKRKLLTDPQTSGGLLVACAPGLAGIVMDIFKAHGCVDAKLVGEIIEDEPLLTVV